MKKVERNNEVNVEEKEKECCWFQENARGMWLCTPSSVSRASRVRAWYVTYGCIYIHSKRGESKSGAVCILT